MNDLERMKQNAICCHDVGIIIDNWERPVSFWKVRRDILYCISYITYTLNHLCCNYWRMLLPHGADMYICSSLVCVNIDAAQFAVWDNTH